MARQFSVIEVKKLIAEHTKNIDRLMENKMPRIMGFYMLEHCGPSTCSKSSSIAKKKIISCEYGIVSVLLTIYRVKRVL